MAYPKNVQIHPPSDYGNLDDFKTQSVKLNADGNYFIDYQNLTDDLPNDLVDDNGDLLLAEQ